MEPIENRQKRVPKTDIKYNVSLNAEQKQAKQVILDNHVILLTGQAGSGKSLLAAQVALDLFFKRETGKIIIIRPVVAAADDIGFLPGSLAEKMSAWCAGIYGNLEQLRPKKEILTLLEKGSIEIVPLAYARSRTFLDAVVIVEEVQNVTKKHLELILGRLGAGSKIICTGDVRQVDLKKESDTCIPLFKKLADRIEGVCIIELETNHRHPIVPQILAVLQEP